MINGFKRDPFKSQSCNEIKNTRDAQTLTPIIMGEMLSNPAATNTIAPATTAPPATRTSMLAKTAVSDDNIAFLYNTLNEMTTTIYPTTVFITLSVSEVLYISHTNISTVYKLNGLTYNPRNSTERRLTESKCVARYTMEIAPTSIPVDIASRPLASELKEITLPRISICVTNKKPPARTTSIDTTPTLVQTLYGTRPYDKPADKTMHGNATSTGNVPIIALNILFFPFLSLTRSFAGSIFTNGFLIASLFTSTPAPNGSPNP
ncbi:unnamed protein product [Debaryomyces fabryi]|nr:unnamed protein product [Debaryomyces fabryi]